MSLPSRSLIHNERRTHPRLLQVFRYLLESRTADRQLRCRLTEKEFLWEVAFVGLAGVSEEGMDWGGLYREGEKREMRN